MAVMIRRNTARWCKRSHKLTPSPSLPLPTHTQTHKLLASYNTMYRLLYGITSTSVIILAYSFQATTSPHLSAQPFPT